MKKVIFAFLTLMVLAVSAVSFTSCGDDDSSNNPLVGTKWLGTKNVRGIDGTSYTFRTVTLGIEILDNTHAMYNYNLYTTVHYKCTYTVSADGKTLTFAFVDEDNKPYTERGVISADGKTMTYYTQSESLGTIELTKQ